MGRGSALAVARLSGTTMEIFAGAIANLRFNFQAARHMSPRSRGMSCPSFCGTSPPSYRIEGAGKAGCALHPRSRVQSAQKKAHTSIQVQRRQSGFPCAVVYGLLRALPGDRAFLPPSLRNVSCKAWRQHRGARTTRLRRPPHARSSVAHSASTASHRNVRDDREPPLIRVRRARPTPDLPDALSGIFFARGLDD